VPSSVSRSVRRPPWSNDASRFALVAILSLGVNPWEALPYFGKLLTGQAIDCDVARFAGFFYHCANGVGFAVAYVLLLGHRGFVAGLMWALGLEVATLAFYPGWLDIRAIGEFTTVAMAGHVNVIHAVIVFAVVVLLLIGRGALARTRFARAFGAVALFGRYGLAVVASWLVTEQILGLKAVNDRFRTDSFVVALIAVVVSLGLFMSATASRRCHHRRRCKHCVHGLVGPGRWGGGRRSNNQSENRRFKEAVRRIEQETGRKLRDDVQ
jgi:hypothetical protein